MYKEGDKVAHPADGACVVITVSEKEMGGTPALYYTIAPMTDKNMVLFVPVKNADMIGLRKIISHDEADTLLSCVSARPGKGWIPERNARFKHYAELFKIGGVSGLSSLLSELGVLLHKDAEKKLPEADKTVKYKIETIALSEIAMAKGIAFETAKSQVQEILLHKSAAVAG